MYIIKTIMSNIFVHRYMMSRDYLGLKVWDLRMETKPVETYPVSVR